MPQKTRSAKRERHDAHINDHAPEGARAKFEDSVLAAGGMVGGAAGGMAVPWARA